jgi:rhodanese-related sulfurtransferase
MSVSVQLKETVNSRTISYQQVREALLHRKEIAILDVREEAIFATGHPLFAANLPYSVIETEAYRRIPRRDTLLVVYDNGEELAGKSISRLEELGYTHVLPLEGGLKGWEQAGGEIFIDVNAPSKAFGELVDFKRHTPSLSAEEVDQLIKKKDNIVVLDARRYDEYQTMSIPGSISVPGAELVFRVQELAPDPQTLVIVNCAGRTRSIIGTQSLVNAGIPNRVAALRNGTIGWTLAGQKLEHGQSRHLGEVSSENNEAALLRSRSVAARAGVKKVSFQALEGFLEQQNRTTYLFDVRTPDEYQSGHLQGFLSAPGGQLVQETDHFAPVRGARLVLADTVEVRANMTASWLAQMNWEVFVLETPDEEAWSEKGFPENPVPAWPDRLGWIGAASLAELLQADKQVVVIDLASSRQYQKGHIPGSWYALRSRLAEAVRHLPPATKYILTSPDGVVAAFAAADLRLLTDKPVFVLEGGTGSWTGQLAGSDDTRLASPPDDRYKRPYEGTNNASAAMEAYLEWEYGLVAQLDRDATHGFFVI